MNPPNTSSRSLKRYLAYVLLGLVFLVLVLHLPPTKRLLRPLVSATLSWAVGGPVELGALDYALWRGRVELYALRVVPDRNRLPFELAAQRIELGLSPLGRARVRLDAPDVTYFWQEGETVSSRRSFLSRFNPISLSQLELSDGTARVVRPSEDFSLEIRSIALELERSGATYRAQIQAADGTLTSASPPILFGPLEGNFEMRGRELSILGAQVEKGDSRVQVNGEASSLDPLLGGFDVDFRVDTEILRELRPDTEFQGVVAGSARFDGEPDGTRVTANFRSEELRWNGLAPWTLVAEASFADGTLRIDSADLDGYGGSVQARAEIDFAQDRQDLRADFEELDLGRASSDLGATVSLASQARGNVRFATTGWDLDAAEGEGRVELTSMSRAGASSLPVAGDIDVALSDGAATIATTNLSIPNGGLELHARVAPVDPGGSVEADYRVRLDDLGIVPRLLPDASEPIETAGLAGGVTIQGRASGPLSDIAWNGSLTSQDLRLLGEPYAMDAQINLVRDLLRVDSLSLRRFAETGPTETLLVEGEVPLVTGAGAWGLRGEVDSFPIEPLSPVVGTSLQGTLSGRFEVTGRASDPDWSAEMRVTDMPLPREGVVAVQLRKTGRDVFLENAELVSPAGSIESAGSYQLDDGGMVATVRAREVRLADLTPLREALGDVDGVIEALDLELQGPARAPIGVLRFTVREPSLRGVVLPTLDAELTSNGENTELLARLDDGRTLLTATAAMESPYPIEASLDLSALPLERLLQSDLILGDPEVLAQAWGQIDLAFSLLDPSQIQYRAWVEQLVGSYHGIGGGAGAPFSIEGDRQAFRVEELDLIGDGTAIAINGRVPLAPDQAFDLRLRGDARLELLAPALEAAEPAGRASADLHLQGTLDQLDLTGDIDLDEAGAVIYGIRLDDVSATLDLDTDRVRLPSLSGRALGGNFHVEGVLPVSSPQPAETTRLQFEVTEIDLARLVFEDDETTSQPKLRVTTSGAFETRSLSLDALVGSGSVSRVEAGIGELTLTNPAAATWRLADGRFELPELRLTEAETDVGIRLVATLTEDDVAWEASLSGRLDNALANPLVAAEGIVLAGATTLDLRAQGTSEDFRLGGTGAFEDARVVVREPPLVFSNLQGDLRFDEERITLEGLTAEVGGGRVEGSGTIDLDGVIDLSLEADSVRLSYPEGLRSEQSGSFRLSGGPEDYFLSGDLWVLQSLFHGELTLESGGGLESMPDLSRTAEEESFPERLFLDLRVQTVEDLRIDNNTAELQAAGNLVLSGTLASPEIDGVVTVRPDGTFRLGRNTYRIDSGQMVLRGYPTEAPELDLAMRTTVSGVTILMDASGSIDDLNIDLSAPDWQGVEPLTQSDLASLLATGRTIRNVDTLGNISEEGQQFVTEQAVSMLGASLAGIAEASLGEVLPFRSITVDPARIASEVDPNARFTLGVGVTDELTVTYSVALNNSRSRLWVVDYLLPKNVELRGTQLEDEFTGGVSQRLFFDLHERLAARRAESGRRVDIIRLVGAPPDLESPLREAIQTETDDAYDYWETIDDVRRLSNVLREDGYLGALVDVEAVPVEEGIVDLVYLVDPGERIEIVWQGDDPGDQIREAVASAWDGRVPESLLVTELARLAQRELWQQRYFQAVIETTLEDAPGGTRRAIFDVSRGPQSAGLDIVFEGNVALSDRELRSALPADSSPDLYDSIFANPERLREILERFYGSRGYLDARAHDVARESAGPGGRFRVIVSIEEGEPSPIATVELKGATSIPAPTLLGQLSQHAGAPFLFPAYQQDRATLASVYRQEGYVEARVRGGLERTTEGLAVTYEIDEGPRAVVGTIRVAGNQVTRTSIIRRQLTLREGDPLRLSELTESQSRLYDLGIFRSVDVRVEPASEDALTRDVVVEVIETSDLNVSYGLRYSSETNFQIQTQLGAPNVFGGGQNVGLTVRADRTESLVRATFHTPYLLSRFDLATDIFVSRETQDSEFFLDRFWSVTFQQTRGLKDWLDLLWSYSFRRVHSEDKFPLGPLPLDTTIYKNILGTSLIADRRDSLFRPARGHYWSVSLQVAPSGIRNDVPFAKTFGQLITFVPLGHDLVWAASYRLGVADNLGDGLTLLPDDRFTAGGIDSVRGFRQDSLGPKFPGSNEAIGGKAIAVFNQELRFPVYRWFQGGAFVDAGNVYLERSDFDPFDLRYSAGLGLRVLLPFGLIRLDWARALDREPGEEASQFWFSFGHAF